MTLNRAPPLLVHTFMRQPAMRKREWSSLNHRRLRRFACRRNCRGTRRQPGPGAASAAPPGPRSPSDRRARKTMIGAAPVDPRCRGLRLAPGLRCIGSDNGPLRTASAGVAADATSPPVRARGGDAGLRRRVRGGPNQQAGGGAAALWRGRPTGEAGEPKWTQNARSGLS
jgi:hypothetical protein